MFSLLVFLFSTVTSLNIASVPLRPRLSEALGSKLKKEKRNVTDNDVTALLQTAVTAGKWVRKSVTVTIGSSRQNSKSVGRGAGLGLECPEVVDKSNWLGGHRYPDKFTVSVSGNRVTVKREDNQGGWGMNLQFACSVRMREGASNAGSGCFISSTLITVVRAESLERVPISSVNVGDRVLGKDKDVRRVHRVAVYNVSEEIVGFAGRTPFVTKYHPIATPTGRGSFDPETTMTGLTRAQGGRNRKLLHTDEETGGRRWGGGYRRGNKRRLLALSPDEEVSALTAGDNIIVYSETWGETQLELTDITSATFEGQVFNLELSADGQPASGTYYANGVMVYEH